MVKSLTDYTNHFSPNNFKKNDSMILNYFLKNFKMVEINSIESIQQNSIDTSTLNK